ncbi:MAG: VOC family protein [Myxococcota bacterium]
MIRACHHIGLNVHDLEEAKTFWGGALGLEEVERPEAIKHYRSVWYQLGVSELHVIENKAFIPTTQNPLPHIAMAVREEDYDAVIERVRAAGFKFGFGPAKGPEGVLTATTLDPSGNSVEITVKEMTQTSV